MGWSRRLGWAAWAGGTVAVVAELLPASRDAMGSLLRQVFRVRGGGLLTTVLQRSAPTELTGNPAARRPYRVPLDTRLSDDAAA
jgi:hypothetical protein